MYRRPFLVLPGGDCVPLEGDYRLEQLRGEWYVLGHNSVARFDTQSEAVSRLVELTGASEPDLLAGFVLELDPEHDLDLELPPGSERNPSFS